jgi:hypothetical protein
MGLDMYFTGKRRVSCYTEPDKLVAQKIQDEFSELEPFISNSSYPIVNEISAELMYWRKANAIHNWFVKHVQDGIDDCKPYSVSRKQLTDLKDVCERVLGWKELATDLIPPTDGFFFGSTEIDEFYWADLKRTAEAATRILALPKEWAFEYQSSW